VEPYIPQFPDADRFKGEIVHTAHLDGRRTFFDKDVVVVGSGSTAVCCAPELGKVSRSLHLIQRSPSYIYESTNEVGLVTALCQALYRAGFHLPVRLLRCGLQCKDDLIFVAFRRFPRFARWFFKRHWMDAVGEDAFRRHFSPRYNPWEQRIPVAVGLKESLRRKEISISTGEIERFTPNGIVLKTGERVCCDVCVLATGYDLDLLKFDLFMDETKICMGDVNCYRRLMLGSVSNYFHPLGVWHSAWTQSSETLTRYAIRIIAHMRREGFRTVSIDRQQIDSELGITPNYVLRCRSQLPTFHGTFELPSIDNLVSFRFDPTAFNFS
jgi:cation diffusion facilitator CzcD-associated flavoprotein CzcO